MAGGQEKEEDALKRRQQARIKEQARRELEKEQQVEAEIAKVKEVYGEKEEEVVEAPLLQAESIFDALWLERKCVAGKR